MSYAYQSADGLARSNDPNLIDTWNRIGQEHAAQQRRVSEALRAAGVKAEHPDDGWVDRGRNTVQFVYPPFNDQPDVGDMIALGCPHQGYRVVRVTEVEHCRGVLIGTTRYHFDPEPVATYSKR